MDNIRLGSALMSWIVLSVAAGCAWTGGASQASTAEGDFPRGGEPSAEEQRCSRDTECVLVDDCCGCARGGLRMAVHSQHLQAVSERADSACAARSCGPDPSQHRSCTAHEARCVGGNCLPKL